jgi:hypothetical protein
MPKVTVVRPDIPGISIPAIPGARGEKGLQGDPGPPGLDGSALGSYQHQQAVPSEVWTIEHPLGFKPAVTVVDSAGSVVYGDVSYSNQTVTIIFSAGFSGTAYLS